MTLGNRVKMRREELGLTQEQLAERMGYSSRTSINKIENGRPCSQKIIIRLANALDVSIPYLMGWEDEELKTEKPPTPEEQEQEARTKEFIELFRILPPEYQVLILTQIRGLLTQLK